MFFISMDNRTYITCVTPSHGPEMSFTVDDENVYHDVTCYEFDKHV